MHHHLGLGDFIITTGEGDQLPLATGGAQNLLDPLTVVGDQSIRRLQDRGRGAVVVLQLHHRAGDLIRGLVTEVVLETHQDREIGSTEAVDTLVGITHHEHRTTGPVVEVLRVFAIGDKQLDQVVLGAVGVLIFIHQHVAKAAVPVMPNLLMLLQQLNRHEQKIVEIKGIVRSQGFAITAIHISRELAALTFRISFELIRQPTLIFGIADRPSHLFGLKPLGIELQLLGHDLLHEALGIGLVVDRELLCPGESLFVFELVDVVTQHARKQGMERSDPQLLGDLAVDARAQLTLLHWRQGAPGLPKLTLR